jgi:hypothetical protein
MASGLPPAPWTAQRFFDLLQQLGRLRVISVCGPSVFEAICEAAPYFEQGGHLNMITPAYHWHFAVDRLRHLRSVDAVHARSGRRALHFELREREEASPFLRIYVFRSKEEDFDPAVLERFAAAHRELADGVAVVAGDASATHAAEPDEATRGARARGRARAKRAGASAARGGAS